MSGEDDISTGPRQRRGSGREEAKQKVPTPRPDEPVAHGKVRGARANRPTQPRLRFPTFPSSSSLDEGAESSSSQGPARPSTRKRKAVKPSASDDEDHWADIGKHIRCNGTLPPQINCRDKPGASLLPNEELQYADYLKHGIASPYKAQYMNRMRQEIYELFTQVQLAHAHNKAMQVHVKAVDHTSMLVYQQLQAVHARLNVSIRTQHQMRLELEELKQAAGRGGPACTPAPPHHAAAVP